jgi:hypothetical protein
MKSEEGKRPYLRLNILLAVKSTFNFLFYTVNLTVLPFYKNDVE